MGTMKKADTWNSLGNIVSRIVSRQAGRRAHVEIQKVAVVTAPRASNDGAGGLHVETAIGGEQAEGAAAGLRERTRATSKSALTGNGEESTVRASAYRGGGALIVGTEAHHEFGFWIAAPRCAAGRAIAYAPLKLDRLSHA